MNKFRHAAKSDTLGRTLRKSETRLIRVPSVAEGSISRCCARADNVSHIRTLFILCDLVGSERRPLFANEVLTEARRIALPIGIGNRAPSNDSRSTTILVIPRHSSPITRDIPDSLIQADRAKRELRRARTKRSRRENGTRGVLFQSFFNRSVYLYELVQTRTSIVAEMMSIETSVNSVDSNLQDLFPQEIKSPKVGAANDSRTHVARIRRERASLDSSRIFPRAFHV